jgi:hypothetical protein
MGTLALVVALIRSSNGVGGAHASTALFEPPGDGTAY